MAVLRVRPIMGKMFILLALISFILVYRELGCPKCISEKLLQNVQLEFQADEKTNGLSEEDLQVLRVENYRGEGNETSLYYFIPRPYKISSYNYPLIIEGRDICGAQDPYLLVIVPSVVEHVQRRSAIRSTWASPSRTERWLDGTRLSNVKVLFLFGQNGNNSSSNNNNNNNNTDIDVLEKENKEHGDIVQADFMDSYRNLTRKMITALCWVHTHCPRAKYVLKADEDTFVHLPNMIKLLNELNSTDSFVGMRFARSIVLREGRWAVAYDQYPMETFPHYVLGNFYAFSTYMAPKLCSLAEYFPYVPIEDAYITGILRTVLGAQLREIGNSCFAMPNCNFFASDKVAVSNLNEMELHNIWNTLRNKS